LEWPNLPAAGRSSSSSVVCSSTTPPGAREVILGWDKGIATMTKGEHAVLTCSPDYAYGSRAVGPIPANSTLEFEVELVGWEHKTNTGPMLLAAVGISMFAIFAYLFYFSYKHGRIKED
jgi:hypothetical protein